MREGSTEVDKEKEVEVAEEQLIHKRVETNMETYLILVEPEKAYDIVPMKELF